MDPRTAGHHLFVTAPAVSPDGRFVASSSKTTIIIWDIKTRRAVHEWPYDDTTHGTNTLAFSPGSARHRLASCGGEHGRIALWDVLQGRLLAVLTGHSQPIRTCVVARWVFARLRRGGRRGARVGHGDVRRTVHIARPSRPHSLRSLLSKRAVGRDREREGHDARMGRSDGREIGDRASR